MLSANITSRYKKSLYTSRLDVVVCFHFIFAFCSFYYCLRRWFHLHTYLNGITIKLSNLKKKRRNIKDKLLALYKSNIQSGQPLVRPNYVSRKLHPANILDRHLHLQCLLIWSEPPHRIATMSNRIS